MGVSSSSWGGTPKNGLGEIIPSFEMDDYGVVALFHHLPRHPRCIPRCQLLGAHAFSEDRHAWQISVALRCLELQGGKWHSSGSAQGADSQEISYSIYIYIYNMYIIMYIYIHMCVCVCISICLFVCLSIYLSVKLSSCLSICLSIYLSVYLSVCLSIYLFIYLSIFMWDKNVNYIWRSKEKWTSDTGDKVIWCKNHLLINQCN